MDQAEIQEIQAMDDPQAIAESISSAVVGAKIPT